MVPTIAPKSVSTDKEATIAHVKMDFTLEWMD